jgi:hypothetical protein
LGQYPLEGNSAVSPVFRTFEQITPNLNRIGDFRQTVTLISRQTADSSAAFADAKALFWRIDMRASSLGFLIAVLAGLVGMAWGIAMAISHDHAAMPAHAHLNLLGWVSLFLFGIYYRLHPLLDKTVAARAQVGAWALGTGVLTVGVGMIHTGHPTGEPFAGVGSIVVLADMLLFGWLVLRQERAAAAV